MDCDSGAEAAAVVDVVGSGQTNIYQPAGSRLHLSLTHDMSAMCGLGSRPVQSSVASLELWPLAQQQQQH